MTTKPVAPRQSRQSKRFHAARAEASRDSQFKSSQFNSSQFKPSQFRTTQAHGWDDVRGDDRPSEFRREQPLVASISGRGARAARGRRSRALSSFWLITALVLAGGSWAIVQWVPMLLRH